MSTMIRKRKRCPLQGKIKFRDAGEASRYVLKGERMGLYRCKECGFFHLTSRAPS